MLRLEVDMLSEQDKEDWSKKVTVIPPEQRNIKVTSMPGLSERDKVLLRALKRLMDRLLSENRISKMMALDSIELFDRLLKEDCVC